MKKLFLLLVVITHISLQAVTKFKNLNRLPNSSQVRCNCEREPRARLFFSQGKVEQSCDFIDDQFDIIIKARLDLEAAKREKDWLDGLYKAAKIIRDTAETVIDTEHHQAINRAIKTIIPNANSVMIDREYALLLQLAGQIAEEEIQKSLKK